MMPTETSSPTIIDIEDLGIDQGAHLLIKRALREVEVGQKVGVRASGRRAAELCPHLLAWCRAQGHEVLFPGDVGQTRIEPGGMEPGEMEPGDQDSGRAEGGMARPEGPGAPASRRLPPGTTQSPESPIVAWIIRGAAQTGRWCGAARAGKARPTEPGAVADNPPGTWGLAARGATVEAGSPDFYFALSDKDQIWSDDAARLYQQAVAAQWDPSTAIDWNVPFDLPDDLEDAVVQVMTYLIENENAALVVPARFLGQVHPHFKEVMQVLAIQCADEARHVEVFTRRALLKGRQPALSTASGQASLKTLLDEPDFATASFLLSVLGEGSFLNLLNFLQYHAPDPVTRQVAKLSAQDEARHVAFGMAHLQRHLERDPSLHGRLAAAIERRHDALAQTAGLNEEVFDALVLLAAREWRPGAIGEGYEKVQTLKADMDAGRRARLEKLGFGQAEAGQLSGLHTRNFM